MGDEDLEKRLQELEITAAKAETALYYSKWVIGALFLASAGLIGWMGYLFLGNKIEDIGRNYLDRAFGVNLIPFEKKVQMVNDAITRSKDFVFIGQVEPFDSTNVIHGRCFYPATIDGHEQELIDCKHGPCTTVCLASCPDAEKWVLLSGECGIRNAGGTGYLQNMGYKYKGDTNTTNDPNSEENKPTWTCTWQPVGKDWAVREKTIATAYCARKLLLTSETTTVPK